MKLISMADFVLEQVKNAKYEEFHQVNETFVNKVINYAKLLKQPLKLWVFVPCDEDGDVLKEPKDFDCFMQGIGGNIDVTYQEYKHYQQAKERCLLDGFSEKDAKFVLFANETIEDLCEFNLQLTKTAIKQLEI